MIHKDLQLALDQGRASGVPLPLTSVVQEWMTAARGLGLGGYDFAIVFDGLAALGAAGARELLPQLFHPAGERVALGGDRDELLLAQPVGLLVPGHLRLQL